MQFREKIRFQAWIYLSVPIWYSSLDSPQISRFLNRGRNVDLGWVRCFKKLVLLFVGDWSLSSLYLPLWLLQMWWELQCKDHWWLLHHHSNTRWWVQLTLSAISIHYLSALPDNYLGYSCISYFILQVYRWALVNFSPMITALMTMNMTGVILSLRRMSSSTLIPLNTPCW